MSKNQPFDLRKENPTGRVDVLAANLLERFAACVPELAPIVEEQKGAIHMRLNELCGPHVVDLKETMETVSPFLPLLDRVVKAKLAQQAQFQAQQSKGAAK